MEIIIGAAKVWLVCVNELGLKHRGKAAGLDFKFCNN